MNRADILSSASACVLRDRAATNPAHADNWIDLAGYAACGGEIATNDDLAGGETIWPEGRVA